MCDILFLGTCRAALLAVWAAEALLLAFALKLKVSGALAAFDSPMPTRAATSQVSLSSIHSPPASVKTSCVLQENTSRL